MEGLLTA